MPRPYIASPEIIERLKQAWQTIMQAATVSQAVGAKAVA